MSRTTHNKQHRAVREDNMFRTKVEGNSHRPLQEVSMTTSDALFEYKQEQREDSKETEEFLESISPSNEEEYDTSLWELYDTIE